MSTPRETRTGPVEPDLIEPESSLDIYGVEHAYYPRDHHNCAVDVWIVYDARYQDPMCSMAIVVGQSGQKVYASDSLSADARWRHDETVDDLHMLVVGAIAIDLYDRDVAGTAVRS